MATNELRYTKYILYTLAVLSLIGAAMTEDPPTDDSSSTPTERFTQAKSQELKDARTVACENVEITVKLYSDEEMAEKRKSKSNPFVETVDLLFDVYKNSDYMKLLNMQLVPLMISVVFLVFIILSLLIFFINICICCCNGKEEGRGCYVKCNLYVAFVGLVGFGLCCILLAVYAKNVKTGMTEVNCSLNTLSNDLINGNLDINGYIGFFPLTNIIGSFTSDLDKLVSNHKGNLQTIVDLNLKADSQAAAETIQPFVTKFENSMTPDGEGTMSKPLSVTDVLPSMKTGADAEFKAVTDICILVEDGALAAQSQVNNPSIDSVKESLNSVNGLIDGISNTIHGSFGTIGKGYTTIDTNYEMGQMIYVIFCFVCFATAMIIFISLCCAVQNKGCQHYCICRICISVLGLCTLLFMLFSFVIGAVTFITSSSCGVLKDFSSLEGITKFVDLFSFDAQMKTILVTCLLETGDGKLTSIFLGEGGENADSSNMFKDVESILSVFDEYKKQLELLDPNNNSLVLKAYTENIVTFETGEVPDHVNVLEKLVELNGLMNCANEGYAFVNSQCESGKTCKLIKDTAAFVPNDCQSNPAPAVIFTNLKNYLAQTSTLITNMTDDSYGADANTPNSKFKAVLVNFRIAVAKFDLIKADLASTLDLLQNNNLIDGANCKIVRAEFQSLEHSLCFNFVPTIYQFMLIALIASVLFFIFIWSFCCGIFCLERSGEHGTDQELQDNAYHNPNDYNPNGNNKYAD